MIFRSLPNTPALRDWPAVLRSNQAALFVVSTAAFVLLLASRRPTMLRHPQLWAEDGHVFLTQALDHGLNSIFIPYAGYYHLVPRAIAYVSTLFPFGAIPAICVAASAAVWLLVYFYILSSKFEIEEKVAMGLVLLLVPQSNEIVLNVTNLQWVLSLCLIVPLIDRAERSIRRVCFEAVLIAVVGLTGPFAVLFLPVWLVSVLTVRRTRPHAVYAGVVLVCAVVQVLKILTQTRNPPNLPEGGSLAMAILRFFSDFAAHHIALGKTVAIVQAAVVVVTLAWCLWSKRRAEILILFSTSAIVYASFLYVHWKNPSFSSALGDGSRYFFIPYVGLAWSLVLVLRSAGAWQRPLTALCLLWIVQSAASNWQDGMLKLLPWPDEKTVAESARPLQIPINPDGFYVVVRERR